MELSISQLRELIGGVQASPVAGDFGSPYKIVALDKGFVLHGRVNKVGEYIVIDDCKCYGYVSGSGS